MTKQIGEIVFIGNYISKLVRSFKKLRPGTIFSVTISRGLVPLKEVCYNSGTILIQSRSEVLRYLYTTSKLKKCAA
jgi:hypothetical protein